MTNDETSDAGKVAQELRDVTAQRSAMDAQQTAAHDALDARMTEATEVASATAATQVASMTAARGEILVVKAETAARFAGMDVRIRQLAGAVAAVQAWVGMRLWWSLIAVAICSSVLTWLAVRSIPVAAR